MIGRLRGRRQAFRRQALRRQAFRRQGAGRHDAAFAAVLAAVLAIGVVGVLLLNTAMQQQSDTLDQQRSRIADLGTRVEQLRTAIERSGEPTVLARRARALRLRPVSRVHYVSALSAPRSAAN